MYKEGVIISKYLLIMVSLLLVTACVNRSGVTKVTEPTDSVLQFSKNELEERWKARIKSLLTEGKLPLIDMETSMRQHQVNDYIPSSLSDGWSPFRPCRAHTRQIHSDSKKCAALYYWPPVICNLMFLKYHRTGAINRPVNST